MRPKVKPGTPRRSAKLAELCLVGVAVVGVPVVLSRVEALTTVTLVKVIGVAVVLGTSEVELAMVKGDAGVGVEDATEDSGAEEAGGKLEEVAIIGVKLSDKLVVVPELLVVAVVVAVVEGELGTMGELGTAVELGASGELGTSWMDVVEVLHSVVVVPMTVVVVYCSIRSCISIALIDRTLRCYTGVTFKPGWGKPFVNNTTDD
jgi:hypothetical protein